VKSKTDPKTHRSRAILSTQDVASVCRTIDVLNGIAVIEGCHGYSQLSADLRKVFDGRIEPKGGEPDGK
jgi:hypothetical protein